MDEHINIKEYLRRYREGKYDAPDVDTQCDAGWWDWFCEDKALAGKTAVLTKKLMSLLPSEKIDESSMYVFFKNNAPLIGKLYDDFRICSIKDSEVVYTIVPKHGRDSLAYLWGRENAFKEPLAKGVWQDVITFFKRR